MLNYDQASTYSKPDASLIHQWKRKQTSREVGLVEGRVGSLLTDLGYEKSGHSPVVPGAFGKAWFALHHRYSTWTFRVRRFGIVDPVLVALGRRLRIPAIRRSAQSRMDIKTAQNLK